MDSDEETQPTESTSAISSRIEESVNRVKESEDKNGNKKDEDKKEKNIKDTTQVESKEKRVFGPMRPPENYVIPENYYDQETDRDLPEIEDNRF